MLPSVSLPMAKANQPGGDRRRRAGRRAARALLGVPRVARHTAEPLVALGQCAERQLGDEHGAGVFEPPRHGGLHVDRLILEYVGAPGGLVAGPGDQVLRAPGDAVQRTAISAGSDLAVGALRLLECEVLGERDDAIEQLVVALEPRQIELCEFDRRDLSCA